LATNNATKLATQYSDKLAQFGVHVSPSQILTSAETTALYLRHHFPDFSTAYIVGEPSLSQALREQRFSLLESDGFIDPTSRVDAVVVGMTRYVCYPQLASATHLINNGAMFVGTNPDVTFPAEIGPLPGAGSILSFIETATGVQPKIIGKPNPTIFNEALQRLNSSPTDTAMVGDRLSTDIAGALAVGLHTVLLLSGINKQSDIEDTGIKPDWVFRDLSALTTSLNEADQ
jgi:4-nitrophenyl phosphatase